MDALPDITPFRQRFEELAAQMADPTFYNNSRRAADVTREHQRLGELIADHTKYAKLEVNLVEAVAPRVDTAADRLLAR